MARVQMADIGSWLALAALTAACHRDAEVVVPPDASFEAGRPPVDRLAVGELVEGEQKAFGIALPRDLHVDHAFPDVVYASGPARADAVANYLRARVVRGTVRVGAASTLFEQVQLPSNPNRDVSMRVTPTQDLRGCELEIRDVTPPHDVPATEAERWKAAGLAPDGRILDPTHLK